MAATYPEVTFTHSAEPDGESSESATSTVNASLRALKFLYGLREFFRTRPRNALATITRSLVLENDPMNREQLTPANDVA